MRSVMEKVDRWHNVLPVSKERLKLLVMNEVSTAFAVNIHDIEGLSSLSEDYLKEISGKTESPGSIQLRLSLFDAEFGLFFGKTWKGLEKNFRSQTLMNINKQIFLHSSVNREKILLVVELALVWIDKNSEMDKFEVSCGWGAEAAFGSELCQSDLSKRRKSTVDAFKIDLYSGTPRALFYTESYTEFQRQNRPGKISVTFSTHLHQNMASSLHLIPENVFFTSALDLPGVASENLKQPQLFPRVRSTLECLEIRLHPNLEKFEDSFCKLILEDLLQVPGVTASQEDVSITRRTLRVGIHNGQTFVSPLEDIQMTLSSDVVIRRMSRSLSMKASTQQKGVYSAASSLLQGARLMSKKETGAMLVHPNQVEIGGLLNDPSFCIMFALVYEVSLPSQQNLENRDSVPQYLSAMAHPVMEVLVRWGSLSSEEKMIQPGQHRVKLLGGPQINPFGTVAYTGSPPSFGENLIKMKKTDDTVESLEFVLHLSHFENENKFPSEQILAPEFFRASRDQTPRVVETKVSQGQPIQTETTQPLQRVVDLGDGDELKTKETNKQSRYSAELDRKKIETVVTSEPAELKELPYSSLQVPILASIPGMKRDQSSSGLSRATYAQLSCLNFPVVLGQDGSPASVVDANNVSGQVMIVEKEDNDSFKINEIIFQFMAFTRVASAKNPTSFVPPAAVFFTFQFYRFDQITSERLILEAVDKELSADTSDVPFVLRRLDNDGSLFDGPLGYQVKFVVDPTFMGRGEGREFFKYLNQHSLRIDVWDADSLFLIGGCAIDLKVLLRQGQAAVQSILELDVTHVEYVEPETIMTSGVVARNAVIKPIEVTTLLRGKLLLRVGNVGRKLTSVGAHGNRGDLVAASDMAKFSCVATMIKKTKAHRLPEVSYELLQMIVNQNGLAPPTGQFSDGVGVADPAERIKKMKRMEALKKKLITGNDVDENAYPVASLRMDRESRQRDLKIVEMYRKNIKPENIKGILNKHITTQVNLKVSLGTTSFFEFPLANPHSCDVTITIEWQDSDLNIVKDASEWRHFKSINNISTPLEEGMFPAATTSQITGDINSSARDMPSTVELFLRPKEKVSIPFKYLTFRHTDPFNDVTSRFAATSMLTSEKLESHEGREDGKQVNRASRAMDSRDVKVNFYIKRDMKLLAIMDIQVEQIPHIVDQTFRLVQPENTFFKKSFRFPQWQYLNGSSNVSQSVSGQLHVRCSDPNVICTSNKVNPGEPVDVFVKAACGSAPQIKNFYIAIYTDSRLSRPVQIWQVQVKVMQRVDLAAVQGQTARFSLMIRGGLSSRLARCYPSHQEQMSINPDEPFMLLAGNLQQINVGVRPTKVGVSNMSINVVDIESHQLVNTWLVRVVTQEPIISRCFELNQQIGGSGENKKISFTNPYGIRKTFFIYTNNSELVKFKSTRMDLDPGEKSQISMKFLSTRKPCRVEILVFINDEDDKNEETFAVNVTYKR